MTVGYCLFNTFLYQCTQFSYSYWYTRMSIIIMELEGNFIDLSNNEPLNLPLKVKELFIFDHSRNKTSDDFNKNTQLLVLIH